MAETKTKRPELDVDPQDIMSVLLAASMIPDGSTVTKLKGEKPHTLRHSLTVYTLQEPKPDSSKSMVIEGFFLIDERGNINQVVPGTLLCWLISANELVELLQEAWEVDPQ